MGSKRKGNSGAQSALFSLSSQKPKFHLPWINEWRDDFLEASRILSRGRHADEAAQRLIYRLRLWLENKQLSLEDIKVLATVTTPAMLLSAALHRWWPSKNPPAIADLGYYMMLSTTRELPVIVRSGKVVIVQDVLDTHRVSGDLANALKRQGVEVLCVISFIRMVKDLEVTRITPVNYWWPSAIDGLPHHAMIEIRRPRKCAPPKDAVEDAQAYWIEPRTLHPFKYKTLRRDFKAGRDPHLDRRDEYLRLFDNSNEGCLLTAGHYIYGQRHYPVTIDIRRTLTGSVSEEIVRWLANICEGTKEQRRKWESEEGYLLTGDTTAVLMPLQSQIHYIWPRVENLLAQRGRRQPSWWLESTLFTGSGPYHILPEQLIDQINSKVLEAVQSQKGPDELIDKPLRILVLDDAIASAQTAKNILTTIIREVRKAFIKTIATLKIKSRKPDSYPKIIQWIRYFAVLNQMDNARHSFWHNIKAISNKNIQFVFEEYAPFLGVPIYDDKTCPACRDIRRHKHLTARAMQHGAEEVVQWTTRRLKELRPVAVDSPDFQRNPSITLNKPIEVLTTKSRPAVNISKFRFMHADTAIWRFYELMYLSYPPNDVLESLNDSFAAAKSNIEQIEEYERYRWTVFEWCLHNWSRIKANAAEAVFLKSALREVRRNTPLVERIMDGASAHYRDPYILDFVTQQIARLAELERQREEGRASSKSRKEELSRLDSALTIFFLNIPLDELKVTQLARPTGETLLTFLERMARSISSSGHSLLKNLYLTVIRPQRYADPVWALETLAESLFRGRDPEDAPAGNHELLPRLLSEVRGRHVRNEEKRRLLRGSLALFLGALEDIKHYYGWSFSEKTAKIEQLCIEVIDWLKLTPDDEEYTMLPKIYRLEDALGLEGEFCTTFNEIFHRDVGSFMADIDREALNKGNSRFKFTYEVEEDAIKSRLLTNVQGLRVCLENRAIDPVDTKRSTGHYQSKIHVTLDRRESGTDRLVFKLLTNYESLNTTRRLAAQGPSGKAERAMLETFGALFDEWGPPTEEEKAQGFTATCAISVLTGFVPRRLRK